MKVKVSFMKIWCMVFLLINIIAVIGGILSVLESVSPENISKLVESSFCSILMFIMLKYA